MSEQDWPSIAAQVATEVRPRDVWEVEQRKGHGKYVTVLRCETAGMALTTYGRLHLDTDTESKRITKNGRVIDRETGPTPWIRPPKMGGIYEYGVLPHLGSGSREVIEGLGTEDEGIELAQQIKRGGLGATLVRRTPGTETWRDFNGKSVDHITWRKR